MNQDEFYKTLTSLSEKDQLDVINARIRNDTFYILKRVLPDPSLVGRLSTAVNILSSGKYSASDIKNYTNLAKTMKRDLYVGLSKKQSGFSNAAINALRNKVGSQ